MSQDNYSAIQYFTTLWITILVMLTHTNTLVIHCYSDIFWNTGCKVKAKSEVHTAMHTSQSICLCCQHPDMLFIQGPGSGLWVGLFNRTVGSLELCVMHRGAVNGTHVFSMVLGRFSHTVRYLHFVENIIHPGTERYSVKVAVRMLSARDQDWTISIKNTPDWIIMLCAAC